MTYLYFTIMINDFNDLTPTAVTICSLDLPTANIISRITKDSSHTGVMLLASDILS